jgi:uncharacterized lipoprotein YddW (UPF0748 family)
MVMQKNHWRAPRGTDGSVSGRRAGFPRVMALLAACILAASAAEPLAIPRAVDDRDEVRALWVLRASLTTRGAITAMVSSARENGFNTLLVQVRGRGDAYFNGGLEPRAAALASQPPDFDPLRETLRLAHAAGMRVQAWVTLNLISSAADLPISREHLIYRHPEWLMVPRRLVPQLQGVSVESPEYVGKIARWSRGQAESVEGLYVSPVPAGAADHTVAVVSDLVKRYEVDGVHLDYVRFPTDEFDYSKAALDPFRAEVLPQLSAAERRDLDRRLEVDPTVYADMFPERYRDFRQSRLTALVMRVRTAVKSARPSALITAAVIPDSDAASAQHLQDWRTWLENGLIDVLCPMAYTQDAAAFKTQIESARQIAGFRSVWAGIGAYRLTSAQTVENIRAARRAGVNGIVLFSYDSLVTPTAGSDYLAEVARAAFTASSQ